MEWTNWYTWNHKDGVWEFNHTEIGHSPLPAPEPKDSSFKAQRAWKGWTWMRKHVTREN